MIFMYQKRPFENQAQIHHFIYGGGEGIRTPDTADMSRML